MKIGANASKLLAVQFYQQNGCDQLFKMILSSYLRDEIEKVSLETDLSQLKTDFFFEVWESIESICEYNSRWNEAEEAIGKVIGKVIAVYSDWKFNRKQMHNHQDYENSINWVEVRDFPPELSHITEDDIYGNADNRPDLMQEMKSVMIYHESEKERYRSMALKNCDTMIEILDGIYKF